MWSPGMVHGTAFLYSVSAVIFIVTVHGSNMNSKIYKTVLRTIMSAVTVTVSRSLLALIVKFQQTAQLTYAEFRTARCGISASTDRL